MCLRDGMHAKRHQITVNEMVKISKAMDEAGIPMIEVTHGDGLGGASVTYGFPTAKDEEYLTAVCKEMKNAKISALLLPGIGTVDHIRMAVDCGISTIRIATHCTEADISQQHLAMARSIDNLDTVGFLMMAHMIEAEELVTQLKMMEDFGAHCVYITDSAGYMLPDDVTSRVAWPVLSSNPKQSWVFTAITIWQWVLQTLSPPLRRVRIVLTHPLRVWALVQVTRRWRCLLPCVIVWVSKQA